jgi:thioredoxin reductase
MDMLDAIVIGGGSAGLSAALALGRARRRVLVLDGGEPRNAVAPHMHNVLGHDGRPPRELLAAGRAELERYGIEVRRAEVLGAEAAASDDGPRFSVATADGVLDARRLIVATGARDRLADVPGLSQQWGTGVVVCPYCDGWEVRDRPIAVLATGEGSLHHAQLLRQWTDDLVLLVDDAIELDAAVPAQADVLEQLAARGTRVERTRVARILDRGWTEHDPRVAVELADGRVLELARVFAMSTIEPRDGVLRGLGARTVEVFGIEVVEVDAMGATSVPGLSAAGNVVDPRASVAVAMGQGAQAGAWVNADLVQEDARAAVAVHRAS